MGKCGSITSTVGKGRSATYSDSLFNIGVKFLTIAKWIERT